MNKHQDGIEILNHGHTNFKYLKNQKLFIKKNKNPFNHNLNYQTTQQFSFVPKLIAETNHEIQWQYLDKTHQLHDLTNQDLKTVANILAQIHSSKIILPRNNLRKRVQFYLKIMREKHLSIPEVNKHYRKMMKLLTNMDCSYPCHNDVWPENLLKDQSDKIWLIDWEYATMGDYYFDLAYFIESSRLNSHQIKLFIDQYFALHQKATLDWELLMKYRIFANWIILLWAYSQPDGPPFNLKVVKKFLNSHD